MLASVVSDPAAKVASDLDGLVGSVLAGSYRVDKLLGMGGMGAVFRGHQLTLKRDVAIKVLHPELTANEQVSKRFEREAQSAARLEHPNIVQVLEFGSTEQGFKFIVMQLLEGHELLDLLGDPMPIERAVPLFLQVLKALGHAHDHGIIHRDLKPENIFVVEDHDGNELCKLVDFGIAKMVDSTGDPGEAMTKLGMVFGTPQYMSPEQATGMEIDARTDVYSAGLILYAMLAGAPPFDAEDPVALIRMQVSREPPPLPGHVPDPIRAVVAGMLAKDRDGRFASAQDAKMALEQAMADLGIPVMVAGAGSAALTATALSSAGLSRVGVATGSHAAIPTTMPMSGTGPVATPTVLPVDPGSSVTLPGGLELPRKTAIIGASAVGGLLLLLIIGLAARGGGGDEAGEEAVASTGSAADGSAAGGDDDGLTKALPRKSAISDEELAEIDKLILAGNSTDALALIQPLRDEHPTDPVLLWRAGRALALKPTKHSAALARYAEAVDQDEALLDDPAFFAELYELMNQRKLRDEAVNVALQRLGVRGHEFLLKQINETDPNKTMNFTDRHRVIAELDETPESAKLIDRDLNLARDLFQAKKTRKACANFRQALDDIDANPSEELYRYTKKARVPKAGDDEESADCEGLDERLEEVRTKLETMFAQDSDGQDDEIVIDEEAGPNPGEGPERPEGYEPEPEKKTTPKKKAQPAKKKKKGIFDGLFKKH